MTPLPAGPRAHDHPVAGTGVAAPEELRPAVARNANIRDVARAAGVSHQTVSRVINEHPSLRPETRDRVLAAIEELRYRPNRVAQALGSNRSRTICVLTSERSLYGPGEAIGSIERAARDAGYLVTTTTLPGNRPDDIREALSLQADQMVAGLIVIAPQVTVLDAIDELALTMPYVLMNSRGNDDRHEMFVDHYAGARLATRHLLALGHREIVHLAGPQEWIEAEARMQGFLDEMSDADASITPPILGDWSVDVGYRAGCQLARHSDLTAVFSANDQMAIGLIHAFVEAGLSVPGDVSVVGFDDIPEAAYLLPPLTTVRQDFAELGRRCVARLLAGGDDADTTTLTPQLIVRRSTAPPRRSPR